jgi:hypothetical protein
VTILLSRKERDCFQIAGWSKIFSLHQNVLKFYGAHTAFSSVDKLGFFYFGKSALGIKLAALLRVFQIYG